MKNKIIINGLGDWTGYNLYFYFYNRSKKYYQYKLKIKFHIKDYHQDRRRFIFQRNPILDEQPVYEDCPDCRGYKTILAVNEENVYKRFLCNTCNGKGKVKTNYKIYAKGI